MKPGDRAAFARELLAVAELLEREVSPVALEVYWSAVQDIEIDDFRRAIRRHVRRSPFLPKPSDILAALGFAEGDRAVEAWGRTLAAIRRVGRYRSIDLGPEVNVTIEDLGGWIDLCEGLETEQLGFVQSRFMKTITAYIATGVPRGRGDPLPGLEALDCQRLGLTPPEPIRLLPAGSEAREARTAPRLPAPAARAVEAVTRATEIHHDRRPDSSSQPRSRYGVGGHPSDDR